MRHSPYDPLFEQIRELVMCHSPSGVETEINTYLLEHWPAAYHDDADNIIGYYPGRNSEIAIAITAHKDEIGAIVNHIEPDGRLALRALGGSFPWVYGEGAVDILGDAATCTGVLSFGSRHISHESPQKLHQEGEAVRWHDAWVETCQTPADLAAAGIRPGTRVVVGKHRKQPLRLSPDYIASYTLDNKASLAILLALGQRLQEPPVDIYLVASAKEEVGAVGALYFSQRQALHAMVALEICPIAPEYPLSLSAEPVLLAQDGYGLYDERLTQQLAQAAEAAQIEIQHTILRGFGSDASIAQKFGHVPRAACLSFPTQNTHGYEIAHLGAIANCIEILTHFCLNYPDPAA